MACRHGLVAQEEPTSNEKATSDEERDPSDARRNSRRAQGGIPWRFWASALAVLGLICMAMAFYMPSALGPLTPALCPKPLDLSRRSPAWAGQLKGPVERQLKADSVGDALAILQKAVKVAKKIREESSRIKAALAREREPRVSRKTKLKRAKARCVLNTLATAEQIAKMATNLKASIAVCGEDPLFKILPGKFGRLVRSLKKWICVVNIELVIISFFSIASDLADAAVQCSAAVNSTTSLNQAQQVDASCGRAGIVLVQSLVTLAASFQVTIPGCQIVAKGIEQQLKAGLGSLGGTVANFGSSKIPPGERKEVLQRLDDMLTPDNFGNSQLADLMDPAQSGLALPALPGPGRRLFLGGGPGAFMTMCVVDVLQALTQLGLMGVTLDNIVNAECQDPRPRPVTARAVPKFLNDRRENSLRAACASSISSVLAKLGIAVLYLSFTSFHCTNKANVRAICGAGIAGIEASLAGLASAGAGTYLACKEGQRQEVTAALIKKSLEVFVKEKSEEVLERFCPDLSIDCFVDFMSFFENCPVGVTAQCPQTPSISACPGAEACVAEFDVYRADNMGTPWFPSLAATPQQFVDLVMATPACWEYLNCFAPPAAAPAAGRRLATEELQSHARRSLLLQKVFSSDAWRAVNSQSGTKGGLPPETDGGMELVHQLFASVGRTLEPVSTADAVPQSAKSERTAGSDELLEANRLGQEILNQASLGWEQHKNEGASQCFEPFDSTQLLDENGDTIP